MHLILQNVCAADATRAPPCNNDTQTPCLVRFHGSNLLVLPRRSCGAQPSVSPASVYRDVTCIRLPGSRCAVAAAVIPVSPHAKGRQHEVPRVGKELQTRVSRAPSVFFPSINHRMLPAACHTRFHPHLPSAPPHHYHHPSFFHPPLKALIYAPIIARSVNCLKNLSNTKSCMEPLSVSQRLRLGSNSASK